MTAIILGWNPDNWDRWNYPAAVAQVRATGMIVEPWHVRRLRDMPTGADAWLVLQGSHGGLIGHGVVVSEQPDPAAGPDSEELRESRAERPETPQTGSPEPTVVVAFDALLPLGEQVPVHLLHDAAPGIPWDGLPSAGLQVDPIDEPTVRGLWGEFGPRPGPDPTQPVPGTYPQDAVARALVNRYEWDEESRRACLARHGTSCAACGFSFELKYGEAGAGFIQVHHIVPAPQLGSGYQLDPVTDLVPLCANCHAVAHLGAGTPRTVAELRRLIGDAGYLRGSTVSAEELEAQREARRILGT